MFKIFLEDDTIIPFVKEIPTPLPILNDDSDSDSDSDNEEITNNNIIDDADYSSSSDNDNIITNAGTDAVPIIDNSWDMNTVFRGINLEDNNTKTPKLKCSINSVNSVIKSWRSIFTSQILDLITNYTNEYGEAKVDKHWSSITKSDIIDFISILFINMRRHFCKLYK